jgi:site-specific DNA-methyltransferase (adenine-specific)
VSEWSVQCGDCLSLLRDLPGGSVDAIITDPPYGIKYKSGWSDASGHKFADESVPVHIIPELRRVSRFRTAVYWFCDDRTMAPVREALQASGFGLNTMLVWDKGATSFGNLADYAKRTEYILFATLGPVRLRGSRDPNLIQIPRINPARLQHPTEKPVALMSYLAMKSTDYDETVLDPFAGSGSTGVACVQTGRNFIGMELDPGYCDIARRRIADAVPLTAQPPPTPAPPAGYKKSPETH